MQSLFIFLRFSFYCRVGQEGTGERGGRGRLVLLVVRDSVLGDDVLPSGNRPATGGPPEGLY